MGTGEQDHEFDGVSLYRDCSCGWRAPSGTWSTGVELRKLWAEHANHNISEGGEVWVRCKVCQLQSEPLSEQTHIEVDYHGFSFFAKREDVR